MGRRALPKVDPNICLDDYLFDFGVNRSELETDRTRYLNLFDAGSPIEFEVGSGKGLFLRNAALAHPDRRFIGIEIAYKYARYSAYRLAKASLPNAVMIHGDAERFTREIIPERAVDAVHVYFPDPWWKARHRKRRVMNDDFIRQIHRILVNNGRLHFWTDVEEYFDETLAKIDELAIFEGPLAVVESAPEHDLDYRTHFERRMRKHSKPIYRSEFIRE